MFGQLQHGLSYTPEYRVWQTMRNRCMSERSPAYADYGGRGITICDRWLNSPETFLKDMGPRPKGCEIDRINNDGPYSPENCRWVTRKVNDRNRRSSRKLEAFGKIKALVDWCEEFGISSDTLRLRLSRGMPIEVALTTPIRRMRSRRQDDQRRGEA